MFVDSSFMKRDVKLSPEIVKPKNFDKSFLITGKVTKMVNTRQKFGPPPKQKNILVVQISEIWDQPFLTVWNLDLSGFQTSTVFRRECGELKKVYIECNSIYSGMPKSERPITKQCRNPNDWSFKQI